MCGAEKMVNSVANKDAIETIVHDLIEEYAGKGYRTLGVAYCDNPDPDDTPEDQSQEVWVYEGYVAYICVFVCLFV